MGSTLDIGAVRMADLQTAFVPSMAIVIAVAAIIIILFHRFRQPLILGYLVAGMLVGPFVVSSRDAVELLAKLGIILLTFSIGLEFNLKKLRGIGITVITAAAIEIVLMIGFGFQLGLALGWTTLESTLLGAILSVASTMIIVRSLRESGGLDNERARLIVGLLIVEDFAAVLILAAVSGLVSTGGVTPEDLGLLILKMTMFLAASIVFGLAAVPKLVDYVGRQRSGEILIITVLALCFSMAYFAKFVGFTEAIGAFVMGVIISESRFIGDVIRKVEPVRDLFGAIFFITVGMLVDMSYFSDLQHFIIPVIVISAVFTLAKMFSCTLSTFVCGFGARNALGAGLGMIAIGEFSLMIAAVAATSDPALATIYPVVVLVTTVTALIVPYSIKYTDRVTRSFEGRVPKPLLLMASYLNLVVTNLRRRSRSSVHISNEMRNNISTLFVNIVVVISVLVLVLSVVPRVPDYAYLVGGSKYLLLLIVVTASVLLIIPAMKSIWVRSIRLVEVSTSEAMLSTKSAETMGYNATAKALRWSLLGLYIFIGFIIVAPVMHSMIQENLMFAIIAVVVIAVVVLALWSSIQAINSKLSEVFEHRGTISVADTSSDLAEIEEIIAAMERERR
jgi:CPA2 family monovalent cation:H+ antiporter-2